jgi:hypothetical protein
VFDGLDLIGLGCWLAAEDQPVFDGLYVGQSLVQCNIFLIRLHGK